MTRGTTPAHRPRLLAFLGALSGLFLLAGCTGGAAQPDGSTSPTSGSTSSAAPTDTSSATATPDADATTPRPTSTISQAPGVDYDGVTVPATCPGLLTADRWKFATAPLNDPKVVGNPVAIPKSVFDPVRQSDGKRLYCVWRDPRADITTMVIQVEVVDSSKAFGVLQGLQGFDCTHVAEGYRCQKVSTDEQYGVQIGTTYFTRGDIAISIAQANVPTTGLLDDVMAHLF